MSTPEAGPTPARPLPVPDRDSRPWWQALARHELTVQRCVDCAALRWPFRAMCNRCGSLAHSMVPVSGRGTVVSFIVNRHGFSAAFPSPYAVVLVSLAEAPDVCMLGGYDGPADGAGLSVGAPVRVVFEDVIDAGDAEPGQDPVTLLRWSLVEQSSAAEPVAGKGTR